MSSMSDCEYRTQCSDRPMVRVPREVCRAPTPPPVIQRVVERAPTPEPDIVERVIVRPQPQQLIERIIERPRTPPPRIINKEICEPAPPPIVRTRIVKVDPSPRHFVQNCESVCYVTQPVPRSSLGSYAPCTDYDSYGATGGGGGYDQSFSNSYSTSEIFGNPNQGYTTKYVPAGQVYQTQAMPGMSQAGYGMSMQSPMQQQPQQISQQPASYSGYTYGYKPNYPPQQQQQGYMQNMQRNMQYQ